MGQKNPQQVPLQIQAYREAHRVTGELPPGGKVFLPRGHDIPNRGRFSLPQPCGMSDNKHNPAECRQPFVKDGTALRQERYNHTQGAGGGINYVLLT